MNKLTDHFTWDEAACHDANKTQVPNELKSNAIEVATNVEVLRFAMGGIAIHVNSFFRTEAYNKLIGGASQSQHLLAKAMDIWITGFEPITVFAIIEALIRTGRMKQGGLGLYDTFVHYDDRGFLRRWDLRTKKN